MATLAAYHVTGKSQVRYTVQLDLTVLVKTAIGRPACLSCHRKEHDIQLDFTVLVKAVIGRPGRLSCHRKDHDIQLDFTLLV